MVTLHEVGAAKVPHDTALPLALLMLGFTASAAAVQAGLRR